MEIVTNLPYHTQIQNPIQDNGLAYLIHGQTFPFDVLNMIYYLCQWCWSISLVLCLRKIIYSHYATVMYMIKNRAWNG